MSMSMSRYNLRSNETHISVDFNAIDKIKRVKLKSNHMIMNKYKAKKIIKRFILSRYFYRIIIFKRYKEGLKILKSKKNAIKTICSAYIKYRKRKNFHIIMMMNRKSILIIIKAFNRLIIQKNRENIINKQISLLIERNHNYLEEMKLLENTNLYKSKKIQNILLSYQIDNCMMCLEEIPRQLMIRQFSCECKPTYCQMCTRKLLQSMNRFGVNHYNRNINRCIFCKKDIVIDLKVYCLPNIDPKIIVLYKKILLSLGFENRMTNEEAVANIIGHNSFSPLYYLLRNNSDNKLYMFCNDKDVKIIKKLFGEKLIPEYLHLDSEHNMTTRNTFRVINIFNHEVNIMFDKNTYLNQILTNPNAYWISKIPFIPNRKNILDLIYNTDIKNCSKCNQPDILGWKNSDCQSQVLSHELYLCTKCKNPDVRTCPVCNIYMTKIGGCNVITCSCSCIWCYDCNTQILRVDTSSHFQDNNSYNKCKGIKNALFL